MTYQSKDEQRNWPHCTSASESYAERKKRLRRKWPSHYRNEYRRAKKRLELQQIRGSKAEELARMCAIIESRRHKSTEATHLLCVQEGYAVVWRRLRVSGGVGAFQWMPRRKCYRLQVTASVWGRRPFGKFRFCYAWCIEI